MDAVETPANPLEPAVKVACEHGSGILVGAELLEARRGTRPEFAEENGQTNTALAVGGDAPAAGQAAGGEIQIPPGDFSNQGGFSPGSAVWGAVLPRGMENDFNAGFRFQETNDDKADAQAAQQAAKSRAGGMAAAAGDSGQGRIHRIGIALAFGGLGEKGKRGAEFEFHGDEVAVSLGGYIASADFAAHPPALGFQPGLQRRVQVVFLQGVRGHSPIFTG